MSSRLSPHLNQIAIASQSISTLPFPPPKIFTNAMLKSTSIVSLLRDTEPHERVLFTVPALPHGAAVGPARAPRRNTAVAAVLGKEMVEQLRRGGGGGIGGGIGGVSTGEVDVELLLQGAEKLMNNYPIPGASEEVARLRARYARVAESLGGLETEVDELQTKLNRLHKQNDDMNEYASKYDNNAMDIEDTSLVVTAEMLRQEEEEIRQLEQKQAEMEREIREMETGYVRGD